MIYVVKHSNHFFCVFFILFASIVPFLLIIKAFQIGGGNFDNNK